MKSSKPAVRVAVAGSGPDPKGGEDMKGRTLKERAGMKGLRRANPVDRYGAKAAAEIHRMTATLARRYLPEKIILFGSWARGDWRIGSDVDLLVIKRTSRPFIERIGDVLKLLEDGPDAIGVEPLVYTPQEIERMLREGNSFLETALGEGKVLYEASG